MAKKKTETSKKAATTKKNATPAKKKTAAPKKKAVEALDLETAPEEIKALSAAHEQHIALLPPQLMDHIKEVTRHGG